ncbi:hypothetical protein [Aeromonas allosaccharophila]|uniref:hypothetical protein n=1 Tax=Aeromonas allosaccharophila TaxID=656 RepID=UPI0012DFEF21|nr:hypothetical protein [Aeromonas allosaccharophila]
MPLPITITALANQLSKWWWSRYSQPQWLIERQQITSDSYPGWRPRVIVARSLCIFISCDLGAVPKARREQALKQQVSLHAPFTEPGYYVNWHRGRAAVWIWDQAALVARVAEAKRYQVLPESALAPSPLPEQVEPADWQRYLSGLQGYEWQRWQNGILIDSRWLPVLQSDASTVIQLSFKQASPLAPRDRQLLGHLACGVVALLLVACVSWQLGSWFRLEQQTHTLLVELDSADEGLITARHARLRAESLRSQYEARLTLLGQGQSRTLPQLIALLPASVRILQQYDYQPLRLQLLLQDKAPDPREYVRRLEGITLNGQRLHNVQVKLEGNGTLVRLQADIEVLPRIVQRTTGKES